jgi:two-component system response regulator DevR
MEHAVVKATDPALLTEGTRAITVVIVDDHFLVADSLATTLAAADGLEVSGVAGTCGEALVATTQHQPEVLLLDQRLPDGLGTDLLPQLFAAAPRMKVLLVTAEASDSVLLAAIEGGCAGFVRKGARATELIEAIRGAARGETIIDAADLRRLLPRLRGGHKLGDDLTQRERTILRLLVEGTSTTAIAQELVIAVTTARNHVQAVITKLGAHSRLEAVAIALREEIVSLPD